jgi:hypothetical protein
MAAMGGVAASLVASLLLRGLAAWHPGTEIPVQFLVAPDGSTMAFAALIALLTGLLFGIIPARQALGTDPNQVLKSSGGTDVGSRRMAVRDLLLAVQIALCCLLVTASFVALRGLERTLRMPLGFQPEGVVLATMDSSCQLSWLNSKVSADEGCFQAPNLSTHRSIIGRSTAQHIIRTVVLIHLGVILSVAHLPNSLIRHPGVIFSRRNCSTFLNQFFHIFLTHKSSTIKRLEDKGTAYLSRTFAEWLPSPVIPTEAQRSGRTCGLRRFLTPSIQVAERPKSSCSTLVIPTEA